MSDENAEQAEEPTQAVINLNINDARIAEAATKFKNIDAHKDLDEAKKAKKFLVKMRTTLAEAHKIQKAESLAFGRRLDGEKNRLLVLIAEVEDPISDQLTDIAQREKLAEAGRLDEIQFQIDRIKAFATDRHDLSLDELKERRETLNKIDVTEEVFQEFTDQAKLFQQEANAKLLIAYKSEGDRLAEKAEQDRIAEEQAATQKKLDEQQAALDAQAEAQRREQAKRDQDAAEKLAKENAAKQAKLNKQAKEQKAEQKKIDDENLRIAQEATEKIAEAARLAAAPDVEKLEDYAVRLETTTVPFTETEAGNRVRVLAVEKLEDLLNYIRTEVEKMK